MKDWKWNDGKNFYVVATIFLFFAAGSFFGRSSAAAKSSKSKYNYPKDLWKGIIGEAVGEGYQGMYAVTCVYRNRLNKNLPLGCVALKRKDLDQFVEKQGKKYQKMAKEIAQKVFEENSPDITNGATHYENVEKFGMPSWAKKMKITAKIGHHTFFREKTG